MMMHDLDSLQSHFNNTLPNYLAHINCPCPRLLEAIRYSALAKSKRLRPLLVYATGLHLGCSLESLDPIALAIELLHTYSLIHDDLPAMDDDDVRRGQPACHIQFDEATAILAGDALQSMAFQTLLETPFIEVEAKQKIALQFSYASGLQGMIAGQSLDMTVLLQSDKVSLEQLQQVHQLKTGFLLGACIRLPMMLTKCLSPENKLGLNQLGDLIGVTFQIQDDYLDLYGDPNRLGKPQGTDMESNKTTYTQLYNQQELSQLIQQYYAQSESLVERIQAHLLGEIIQMLKSRQH